MNRFFVTSLLVTAFALCFLQLARGEGQQIARADVFSVIELPFPGPMQTGKDAPARDIDFWVRFRHESGQPEYKIHGYWDGDGRGGASGNVFRVRFCPTKAGNWTLVEVHSSASELAGRHQGDIVTARGSDRHPGFWIIDDESPGSRWYKRSDGSHQYIFGNTHYTFLSGYKAYQQPVADDIPKSIAEDIKANARYFKKIRFGLHGDYFGDPNVQPYFDDDGQPTLDGDYSHRPNPQWFFGRVDVAVHRAFGEDLIADLILAGPDLEQSRATIRAGKNGGDPTPFLKYIAARYGSYPNVWLCISNEYDLRKPKWNEKQIAEMGRKLREFLPYPTPLSVHPNSPTLWSAEFDELPEWHDHQIIQRKLKSIGESADVIATTSSHRNKPTINDELSYQGAGDDHSHEDTVAAHLGAFIGGGYGSTGEKRGNKLGQYFWGSFNPEVHTAAKNLRWLRQQIDENITFWRMQPGDSIFKDLPSGFRALAWEGNEYVLGSDAEARVNVMLPDGTWSITQYDVLAMKRKVIDERASGAVTIDAPASRAVMFHLKRTDAKLPGR